MVSGQSAGALRAGQDIINDTLEDWIVSNGNLRSVEAAFVGLASQGFLHLAVPNGSLGLIRAQEDLVFNDGFNPPVIGGDFQVVDAGGGLIGNLLANGGIGVVRAGSVGVTGGVGDTDGGDTDGGDDGDGGDAAYADDDY